MTDGRKQVSVNEKSDKFNIVSRILISVLCLLITVYRYSLSYFLGSNCRFTPTCSAYALDAIRLHGPFKGSWLAICRISRCNPWGGQGHDPVP